MAVIKAVSDTKSIDILIDIELRWSKKDGALDKETAPTLLRSHILLCKRKIQQFETDFWHKLEFIFKFSIFVCQDKIYWC